MPPEIKRPPARPVWPFRPQTLTESIDQLVDEEQFEAAKKGDQEALRGVLKDALGSRWRAIPLPAEDKPDESTTKKPKGYAKGGKVKRYHAGGSVSDEVRTRAAAQEQSKARGGGPEKLSPPDRLREPPLHKRVFKAAKGGKVPGKGSKDTVPAKLTPGEFVVKKSVAEKHGPFLSKFNRGGGNTRYRST